MGALDHLAISRRAALSLLAFAGSACAGGTAGQAGSSGAGTPAPLRNLRILNSFAFVSMDPARSLNWFPEFGAAEALTFPDSSGRIQPWLLESFANASPLEWKLALRPKITLQNGTPVTAEMVAKALRRQLEKNAPAKELLGGSVIEVTGPLAISLRTQKPDAMVPGKLSEYRTFPIYDADFVEKVGGADSELVGKGIFTGPYAPISFDQNRLELARYEGYWQGVPKLPGVVVRVVADPQARLAAVQSGEADFALYPAIETKNVLKARRDAVFVAAKEGKESLRFDMNMNVAPLNDVAVRRALALAINYESLAIEVLDGVYDKAEGMYPVKMVGAVSTQAFDLQRARATLDQAGWAAGAGGIRSKDGQRLEITLLVYPQQPDTATSAVAIQSQLRAAGVEVRILSTEDINASMRKPDASWNAALIFNGTISPSSGLVSLSLRRFLSTGSPNNVFGIADSELDGLIDSLEQAFDVQQQQLILQRIQRLVAERAYLHIAAFKAFPMVVSPEWGGYEVDLYRRWVKWDTVPVRAR